MEQQRAETVSGSVGQNGEDARRELRLNFLIEMSGRAAHLSGESEVCAFVCDGVALLLDSARVSIMLHDGTDDVLRIAASVGIPDEIARRTIVRPGEGISGKVFQTGEAAFVGSQDSMPSESLGLNEPRGVPSFLSVPLSIPGADTAAQVLGVINLTRKFAGAFTPQDLKLLDALAGHTAAQIHKCRLIKRDQERQRMEHELRIASEIQLSLLPEGPLVADSARAAGVCRPATKVGGDFFDYWRHGNRACMVVADVSGHDLGAALVATAVRSVVRSESFHRHSLADLASQINRFMNPDLNRSERLITLCYLELELDSGQLTYCSCGHPHPLLLRNDQAIWLTVGGPMLGISQNLAFEDDTLKLADGDLVVLYTDGVAEAGMPRLPQFGVEGLLQTVRLNSELDPLGISQRVIDAVQEYVGSTELEDDTTVLTVRYDSRGA